MKLAFAFILAYLIGSIPSGVWIGRTFVHKDPRDGGSHNIGTTNSFRVLGAPAGTAVLIIDILKGTLGASLPHLFGYNQHWLVLLCGLAAVIGHMASIFLKFKGGKAVATSAGILLAYSPLLFAVASGTFVGVILITSTVALGSLTGVLVTTIVALCIHDWVLATIAGVLTIVLFIRHIPNLKRIAHHQENIVHFGLYYALQKEKSENTKP
ncbi:glycerol-3-phosphate 1-O-acyltransferase PlsY [Lacticaseibacillus pabuli]|uniref:Glycerol-3-phosphate acyltransferase n=1 Tax=Lacticaseibacillus pabuli TaxID=3025672 RepID=A0ABY7WQW5_9LACO|nr:glycerol-3-phosphate 1-O-acyltransferase PlsY [Lacticaseibacillus sp. KACC 23028]WDF81545.1 glycerol-3-phosphate 1-O-acyltransferase PlsY [Lacticaseibacillus sp. KACC 23028]